MKIIHKIVILCLEHVQIRTKYNEEEKSEKEFNLHTYSILR